MSEYICHTRYNGVDIQNNKILIRRGDKLKRCGDFLCRDDRQICIYRSLIGKQHFAINDDGKGLERGYLSYAIAYAHRVNHDGGGDIQQRFTDSEIEILVRDWREYLKPDCDTILFNDKFFELEPEILRQIAKSINII